MFERLGQHYSRDDHRRALQLLDDPSGYPGLPEITRQKLLVQVYVIPSFQPLTSWSVYASADGRYGVRRVRWDRTADYNVPLAILKQQYPTTYGADADLPSDSIRRRLDELAALHLPLFALPDSVGTDGVQFGIRRETFGHLAEFSWWCEPPRGCEAIAAWYDRFVGFLESSLPAHTDYLGRGATYPYSAESAGDVMPVEL
jgi:hypothetical protein